MAELMRLIQAHLDRYGVSRAEFSRRIGTQPQTVQNWRDNPSTFPAAKLLRGVAEVIDAPYLVVLDAVLVDTGYRDSMVDDLPSLRARIKRLADDDPAALRELAAYVASLELSQDTQPRSDTADLIASILRRELNAQNGDNGGQEIR